VRDVSDVIHQANIDVDETGTEAAAAKPNPASARLIATGAQTRPVQGTGMRKSRSHVPSDEGQPMKAHSQA